MVGVYIDRHQRDFFFYLSKNTYQLCGRSHEITDVKLDMYFFIIITHRFNDFDVSLKKLKYLFYERRLS